MTLLPYTLTPDAQKDLVSIARYTEKTWSKAQALKYAALLDAGFRRIADNAVIEKQVFPKDNGIRVYHCEHHYIFYWRESAKKMPVILAVLHERMNLLEQLQKRLNS